jgi:hypothetical protein
VENLSSFPSSRNGYWTGCRRQFIGAICHEEHVGDEYIPAPDQNTSVSRPHVTHKLRPALRFKNIVSMLVFVPHGDLCPAKWHLRFNAMFRQLCN